MTKLEFMKELESLLPDIPLEERNEALQYYNGYFEDAGEDHEEEVMKDLGSPSKVAAIIKADLNSNATERETRGYFTERGYQDTIYNEVKYEVVGATDIQTENKDQTINSYSNTNSNINNSTNTNSNTGNAYGPYYSTNANQNNANQNNANQNNANQNNSYNNSAYNNNANYNYGATGQSNYHGTKTKNQNTGLILLLAIFTFPIWFPLLMTALGIAIGIIATIFGLVIGFGVAGIAMIVAGVVLFIAGLVEISVSFVGILLVGSGLIVFGLGMLFTLGSFMLCKTVIPAFIKGIVNLCRLPFKNRGVMA